MRILLGLGLLIGAIGFAVQQLMKLDRMAKTIWKD